MSTSANTTRQPCQKSKPQKEKPQYCTLTAFDKNDLRHAREKLGRNQRQMAAEIGASHRAYQDWEYGKYPVPLMVAVVMRLLLEKDTWMMHKIVGQVSEDYMRRQGRVMDRLLRKEGNP